MKTHFSTSRHCRFKDSTPPSTMAIPSQQHPTALGLNIGTSECNFGINKLNFGATLATLSATLAQQC